MNVGDLTINNSQIVVLCDTNTSQYCLPILRKQLMQSPIVITVPAGEVSKTSYQYLNVIEQLIAVNIDRNAIIINLGGGVISDLGGFIASTYKRGLEYINIPTSLLAMVDASIGGKTGIDFNRIKNVIGTFYSPKEVITNIHFLETLPERELLSGFAEMLKYGIISEETLLIDRLMEKGYKNIGIDEIKMCQNIKHVLVAQDPYDLNVRKSLNFGHTFGHAFESLAMGHNRVITHGHAVAMGLLCELYLSTKIAKYSKNKFEKYYQYICCVFNHFEIVEEDIKALIHLMLNDKKNTKQGINCILINEALQIKETTISQNQIIEALVYYRSHH